jgi:predicted DNA-binding antitoxin AbrB/MazE fold protein
MTIDVDAVYEDDVLKPKRPLPLKEQVRVHVTIETKAETTPAAADPAGGKAIDRLIACIEDTPPGAAMGRDQDKHLYK